MASPAASKKVEADADRQPQEGEDVGRAHADFSDALRVLRVVAELDEKTSELQVTGAALPARDQQVAAVSQPDPGNVLQLLFVFGDITNNR